MVPVQPPENGGCTYPLMFPAPLTLSDVHLWQFRFDAPFDAALLSADEQARAERLRIPIRRQQFIAARVGLRTILSRYTGIEPQSLVFEYGVYGKPSLVEARYASPSPAPLHFNMAHADNLALVGVALQHIGVDLEQVRPLVAMSEMAEMSFSPDEQNALAALPKERQLAAFFRTWVRKEAFMKADGDGFRLAATFTLPVTDDSQTIPVGGWTIYDVAMDAGYLAAVAVKSAKVQISYYIN